MSCSTRSVSPPPWPKVTLMSCAARGRRASASMRRRSRSRQVRMLRRPQSRSRESIEPRRDSVARNGTREREERLLLVVLLGRTAEQARHFLFEAVEHGFRLRAFGAPALRRRGLRPARSAGGSAGGASSARSGRRGCGRGASARARRDGATRLRGAAPCWRAPHRAAGRFGGGLRIDRRPVRSARGERRDAGAAAAGATGGSVERRGSRERAARARSRPRASGVGPRRSAGRDGRGSGGVQPSSSSSGAARRSCGPGAPSGAPARAAPARRAAAFTGTARTMFCSTTMSLGPPIISRCSTLSRRTSTRRRRPSTGAASITARRGWRPRCAAAPTRVAAEAANEPEGQRRSGRARSRTPRRSARSETLPRRTNYPSAVSAPPLEAFSPRPTRRPGRSQTD